MALIYFLISLQVLNISRFDYINSIVLRFNKLYIGTKGGVVVYNLLNDGIEATLTDMPAELVVPDPASPDVYFYHSGNVYRWYPGIDRHPKVIASVGHITSLGADFERLYVEKSNGEIRAFSKVTGAYLGNLSPPQDAIWSGKKAELSPNDTELNFLIPMFEFVDGLGRIDYTVFYRAEGKIWVGTDGDGIRCYDAFSHRLRKKIHLGIVPEQVLSISILDDGSFIVGGYGGITLVSDTGSISFSTEATIGLRCDPVLDIGIFDGCLIFATPCGLAYYKGKTVMPRDLSMNVTSMLTTKSGIFVGSDNGLWHAEDITLPFKRVIDPLRVPISDLLSVDSKVLVLSSLGVFELYPDLSVQRLSDPKGWLSFLPQVGCVSPFGSILVATTSGLVELDRDSTHYHAVPFDASAVRVNDMACDSMLIWLATDDGLYMMRRDSHLWRRIGFGEGLPSNRCLAVAIKGDSVLVGTDVGLSILTDFK